MMKHIAVDNDTNGNSSRETKTMKASNGYWRAVESENEALDNLEWVYGRFLGQSIMGKTGRVTQIC